MADEADHLVVGAFYWVMPMKIVREILNDVLTDKRLKDALEEMADHPLSDIGTLSTNMTFVARLRCGDRSFRLSLDMADENGEFGDDER